MGLFVRGTQQLLDLSLQVHSHVRVQVRVDEHRRQLVNDLALIKRELTCRVVLHRTTISRPRGELKAGGELQRSATLSTAEMATNA